MKSFVILMIAYLATSICAYAEAGAYERMVYYYAYLTDTENNGGKAKTWATGCSKNNKPCSFSEFLKFISPGAAIDSNLSPVMKDAKGVTHKYPLLDETAKILSDKKITGSYNSLRIHGKAKSKGDLVGLFGQISNFFENPALDNMPRELQINIGNAVKAVASLRVRASSDAFAPKLAAVPGIDGNLQWEERVLYDSTKGGGQKSENMVRVIDLPKTLKDNPGYDTARYQTELNLWKADQGHQGNLKAAREASQILNGKFKLC